MLVIDGDSGEDGVDFYDLGTVYQVGPARLAGAYRIDEASNNDLWALGVTVNWSNFRVAGFYEQFDAAQRIPLLDPQTLFPGLTLSDLNGKDWAFIAEYRWASNIVRLAYAQADFDLPEGQANAADRIDQYVLGLQHNFSKRTRLWAEYTYVDADTDNENAVSLGIRHDF